MTRVGSLVRRFLLLVAGRRCVEDEDLGRQVWTDVVRAHHRDDRAPREVLDDGRRVGAHRRLEFDAQTRSSTFSSPPLETKARSPLRSVSSSITSTVFPLMVVRALVGPRPV